MVRFPVQLVLRKHLEESVVLEVNSESEQAKRPNLCLIQHFTLNQCIDIKIICRTRVYSKVSGLSR
jgi:hypothetical protein